jgi:hypothetical protein
MVRSCGKVHRFEDASWIELGNLVIFKSRDEKLAVFNSWDWVRYGDDIDEPESDSVPGTPLASCGDNPAVI